jgi:hypothetical protein
MPSPFAAQVFIYQYMKLQAIKANASKVSSQGPGAQDEEKAGGGSKRHAER